MAENGVDVKMVNITSIEAVSMLLGGYEAINEVVKHKDGASLAGIVNDHNKIVKRIMG